MKRDDWVVDKYSARPAGSPDHCFYCGEPMGADHKAGCVIRQRTVVIRMTIEYTIQIPEDWKTHDIESHRNESSWCASNALSELDEIAEHNCLCGKASFEYVREATLEDEKRDGVFVWESES